MLDSDLSGLYGVTTKRLNEQVQRNIDRFPSDFMFQLNDAETKVLRSQFATSKKGRGGRRYNPYAFTEQGRGCRRAIRCPLYASRFRPLAGSGQKLVMDGGRWKGLIYGRM